MLKQLVVKVFLVAGLMMLSKSIIAQVGSISGKILDAKSGQSLPGASVIIDGTSQGSVTDLDGNYKIQNIAPGKYNLKISFIGFTTVTAENVAVTANATTSVDLKMKENVNELQGADVVSRRMTHTDNAVLTEMKKSEQIVNGVSSQQISKSQDRTAAEVVRRIPGITVMDNGYVNIRGLNERYNTVLLNGISTPGMEADKKAFALDLIPSSMLDRIMIYKTGAPELPGEFAGGVIKIETKNLTDEDQISISYTTGVRMNTTFKEFYQAPKGNTDWLGKDDGTRSLPDIFPSSLYDVNNSAELAALGKKLPNAWTAARINAMADQRFGVGFSKNMKFGKMQVANVTSIQYGLTFDSFIMDNRSYESYNKETGASDTTYDYVDQTFKENVRISLIHNWSFLVSPRTKIEFRNFFNQQGSNQAILRSGPSYEEQSLVKSYAYRYQQRTVYSGQFHGVHDFNANRSKLDWTAGYSFANSAEPDFRRIRLKKDINAVSDSIPYQIIIGSSASTLDAGRFYSDMNEHTGTVAVNFEHALKDNSNLLIPKIRFGIYSESKQREFSARWISYTMSRLTMFDETLVYLPLDQIFAPDNINDTDGFKLEEGTNPTDEYLAFNFLNAAYAGITYPVSEKINISGGVRAEHNRQVLETGTYTGRDIEVDNMILSILPSLNTSYNLTPKHLVRLAYSKTVNRPEFRELAPFSYYDFTYNNVLKGNPELKTPSIHNFDVRWEYYPTGNEVISLGAFYKNFRDPIEMYYLAGSSNRNFTFGNAPSSNNAGIELEVKKSLGVLFDTTGKDRSDFINQFLSRTGVMINAAWIDSKINLGDQAVGQNKSRPMMGQSPYIINAGVYFNNIEKKWNVAVLYNIIGNRLYAIGTSDIPDIYLLPRHSLDLTITKGIGKYFEIKAGVQDLLAQDEIYSQDSNDDGKLEGKDDEVFRMQRGAYYTLGFNIKF